MSVEEMNYTEEQVSNFIAQADSAILVLRKDLGEQNQNLVNVSGNLDELIDLTRLFIESLAKQGNIPVEELLGMIVAGVLMVESAEDESDAEKRL